MNKANRYVALPASVGISQVVLSAQWSMAAVAKRAYRYNAVHWQCMGTCDGAS